MPVESIKLDTVISCLKIRPAEAKKELTFPWLYFVMKQLVGKSCRWVYNKVGGFGGILARENLNFQNLRNALFGLLALMFALLQMLSLLNLKAFFLVSPPLHTIFFRLAPPLKPYFFACPPSSNPTSPPYLIKSERSLNKLTHFLRTVLFCPDYTG